jgi:flagellar biosynthesis protein FlhG
MDQLTKITTSGKERAITRVISFTSGKGGVGKTHTVVNVAIGLARLGKSVLILDADLGLANVDIMLGLKPKATLEDFLKNRKTLEQIVLTGPEGISLLPAASGAPMMCNLDTFQRVTLMQAIEELACRYDYLLIDTQAGIGPDVIHFNSASSEVVCIINAEPTSLTDAYAMIKILNRDYGERSISVIVNNVTDEGEARRAFNRLQGAVQRYLSMDLRNIGWVPTNKLAREAINQQTSLLQIFPSCDAARALEALAAKIDKDFIDFRVKGGMQFFFQRILGLQEKGAYQT